jgi:hypothetical protein
MYRGCVAGLRSIGTLWSWLTPRWRAFLLAGLGAIPVTLFYGVRSSQLIADYLASRVSIWPYWAIDWLTNTLALFLVVLLLVTRKKTLAKDISPGREADAYRLLDDVALQGDQPDELGLEKFVARLSRTVVLPPNANSLVISLEAPWGSGKSSVLDLLVRRLNKHEDHPVVVGFNPWLASGTDGISRAFFSQLSGSLRKSDEREIAQKLVTFGEMLEELMPPPARLFPRLGIDHLRRIAGRIPEVDIRGEWERLSKGITAMDRPVAVIIDDIDRLEAGEVTTIFQLVKAVASFPRVAYILAFDPKPVDAALQQGGMYETGREYRDKIVQANIQLPRIPYLARRSFFQTRLDQRVESWKFELTDAERSAIAEAVPLVLSVLRTPRDMKRVLNKTMMTADGLRGEVNLADVLVFETTHAMFPDVVDLVRSRPQVLKAGDHESEVGYAASMSALMAETLDRKKKTAEDRIADFTRMYPGREGELRPLLNFMFSSLFDASVAPPPSGDLRITEPSTLRKLLYQDLGGELSANLAIQFLAVSDVRRAHLAEAVETNSLPALLAHVTPYIATADVEAGIDMLRLVGEAVNEQFRRWKSDSSDDARRFALTLINAIEAEAERWDVLVNFVAHPDFIATTESVVVVLLRDVGLWENGRYLGPEGLNQNARRELRWLQPLKLDEVRKEWVSAARSHTVSDILTRFPNAAGVLFRMRQLSDQPEGKLQLEIEKALQDDEIATDFINLFPPGIGLDGVEKLLTPEAQRRLIRCADANPRINERTAERFIEYLEHRRDIDLDPQ